ncbi:MAG: DUF4157 domain-containing protein, partial [Cyanobacteria bacterium J06635_10]
LEEQNQDEETVSPQLEEQNQDEETVSPQLEEQNQEENLDKKSIQTKLTVGEPGDKYEQEADTVAAKVVEHINSPKSQQPVQGKVEPIVQPTLMRQGGAGGGTVNRDVEQNIQQARGGGQGLADNVRQPMEQAFGADFSGVKVHTGGQADVLNRSLNSRAFATGQDIFFKQGEYNPGSRGGQELLAHELTHVVQQTGTLQRQENSDDEAPPSKKILDHLNELRNVSGDFKRKEKTKKLIDYVRQQLKEYPEKIKLYKKQTEPNTEEKLKVLGEVAAGAARIEFLLGTIYVGGSNKEHKWEDENNPGYLVNYYKKEANAIRSMEDDKNTAPWCSMFATTVQKMVWGSKTVQSGYKVANKFDYDSSKGGKFVGTKSATKPDKNPWHSLKEELDKANEEKLDNANKEKLDKASKEELDKANKEKRKSLVETFFKKNFTPQAGDIMVVRRENAKENSFLKAKSHTTLIEKVEDQKIYTIEGNKKKRVMGRIFDLTKPEDVKEIIFIARQSLSQGTSDSNTNDGQSGTSYSENDLLRPIQEISRLLREYAEERKYINFWNSKNNKVDSVANLVKYPRPASKGSP